MGYRKLGIAAALAAGFCGPAAAQPDWARRGVCYEIFVRSFQDSDGDGIGDLRGLVQRLDYLNDGRPGGSDLGVTCLWLMPIAESPSYHGYDVSDYYRVDPDYGSNDDFRGLMTEAHRRGIHVIVDLVLNHTSSQHPFFQEALRDTASPHREWFRWTPTHPAERNPWGGDNWHRSPVRDEYFYGFFWSGMPDLNYRSLAVRAEARRVADYWLGEMGADGFRLDAVSFLVEDDHAHVQHTAGTHAVLREFGTHVRTASREAFTIGEVWDSTATLPPYYPDQLDAYFEFELSDSILASVREARAAPVMAAASRAAASIPVARWGTFLRNHDQERTLNALGGDMARARTAAALLLTLPGIPFVYYGEEIGLAGTKTGPEGDVGVRTPLPWSATPNGGFTVGAPWHAPGPGWERTNVAAQEADTASLLQMYRRLIALRTSITALSEGEWLPVEASNTGVVAFLRRHQGHSVLVLINLTDEIVRNVSLGSGPIMREGVYTPHPLLGGGPPRPFHVGTMRALNRYTPFPLLRPRAVHILQL